MLAAINKATLLMAVVGLLACDSDAGPKTLSKGDVTDLPAGNAAGASFSGTYAIASSVIEECRCRQGPSSGWHASTGNRLLVKQADGALRIDEIQSMTASPCLGGIDKDGKLWCGFSDAQDAFTLFGRWEGTAVAGTSLALKSSLTFAGTIDGQYYDCDVRGHFDAPYVGP